ncbi:MAG: T9SS type A sorting domain-containing protein, partial [Saprospiraceae bacterium]|nr:T9SS type A sorting domain-containing protein [Saprospiraceae bacterium]
SNIQKGISEVDISNHPSGVYFVKISSEWGKQNIKIIKN